MVMRTKNMRILFHMVISMHLYVLLKIVGVPRVSMEECINILKSYHVVKLSCDCRPRIVSMGLSFIHMYYILFYYFVYI